jgi:hypothetical protein
MQKKTTKKEDTQETNGKMAHLSIVTLNVSTVNILIKKQRLPEWLKRSNEITVHRLQETFYGQR